MYSTNQLTLEQIYVTFEGIKKERLSGLEKNNLQTVQAKLDRVDSLICTPKKLDSHSGS